MGGVYNISISQDQFQNNFILDNDTTYHLVSPLLLNLIHRNFIICSSDNQIIGRL